MATKRPTPAPTPELTRVTVMPEDVRAVLNLRGAVLAYHRPTAALLVVAPVTRMPHGYEVLATADVVHGYLLEYGCATAAAEQLTAELTAELVTA